MPWGRAHSGCCFYRLWLFLTLRFLLHSFAILAAVFVNSLNKVWTAKGTLWKLVAENQRPTAAFHRNSSDQINPKDWVKEDGLQPAPDEISRRHFWENTLRTWFSSLALFTAIYFKSLAAWPKHEDVLRTFPFRTVSSSLNFFVFWDSVFRFFIFINLRHRRIKHTQQFFDLWKKVEISEILWVDLSYLILLKYCSNFKSILIQLWT